MLSIIKYYFGHLTVFHKKELKMLIRREKVKALLNNRWLVFVVSMWIQSCAGIGYMFGSISPIIKSSMGYNQSQVAMLGVAKDMGDSLGFIAGALSELLPFWGILLLGVVQNFVGYGLVWLIVTARLPVLPFWLLCICIFVATNGETYFNTATLVSGVQNFPKSRGPIVGILKGFAGLSGAILSQVYHMISSTNNDSIILMVTVGPAVVVLSLMFIIRNVEGHRQARPSDAMSFTFIYGVCLLLAAYMMVVLLVEDFMEVTESYMILFSVILFVILILPIIVPIILTFFSKPAYSSVEENLMSDPQVPESSKSKPDEPEILLSEVESEIETDDEREVKGDGNLNRRKRISQLQSKLFHAAAEGAVRVRRRRGPHRGENFTMGQALVKADLWLMFVSLMLAAGTGVTIIDNLGQMCQSLGYNPRMFVSMISIFNFLGRVGGGYFSEIVVRKYSYPRPVTMAVFQVIMAIGLVYYAMALPGAIYVVTVLVGLGYGAHWAIVPATVSELFGLKSFGALYNFLTMAMPVGSLVFSGVLAGRIYDYYAEKQGGHSQPGQDDDDALTCTGSICFSTTCAILAGIVLIAVITSLIVVRRTRTVYSNLYANP